MRSCARSQNLTDALRTKIFLIPLLAITACKTTSSAKIGSGLRGVTYIYTIDKSSIRSQLTPDQTVRFYFDVAGKYEPIVSLDDSATAEPFRSEIKSENHWVITWHGVAIGENRAGDTEICGERFGYADICDAIFVQRPANEPNANNVLSIGFLERGRALFGTPTGNFQSKSGGGALPRVTSSTVAKAGSSGPTEVDLSADALAQINQHNTGTCLYNSTTGIIEWYRNRKNKTRERLSAPDVLARLAVIDDIGEAKALKSVNQTLGGVVPDQFLGTQSVYDNYSSDFTSAFNYASRMAPGLASRRAAIPQISSTVLFMHQEPANGIRNQKFASNDDMAKVRDWLVNKKRPVRL